MIDKKLRPLITKSFSFTVSNDKLFISNLLILSSFIIFALAGGWNFLERALSEIIQERPLPKIYFPIFFAFGLLMPVLISLINRSQKSVQTIFEPYLILLAGQIITEISLVLLVGKGMGVIVGLVFSLLRLIQLQILLPFSKGLKAVNYILYVQILLWSLNVAQIIFNRMIPLIVKFG